MTLTRELAERALGPRSAEVDEHLRVLTLTNVAAATGDWGSAGPLIEAVPAESPLAGERARHWAMALHARTQDDFFPGGRVHVSVPVLGALLGIGAPVDDRLFECMAAGFDTMCRISAAYSAEAQARGMRPSGFFGPLGAATAAAVALGLDVDGVANAIGLAAASAAGTNQAWISGSDEWLLEVGAAARAGVEAAEFTLAGASASPEAIEGGAGWARAFFGDDGAPLLVARMADEEPGILRVATKPYPVSGIAQVPTRLAAEAHDAVAPELVEVRVSEEEGTYPGSTNRGPYRSRSDALMSIAFCVSCGLRDGIVKLGRLEHPNEPDLAEILERVELQVTDEVEEGRAVLTVRRGGESSTNTTSDAEILYPRWDELAVHDVATRSEADLGLVTRAHELLASPAPDLGSLLGVLGTEPRPGGRRG